MHLNPSNTKWPALHPTQDIGVSWVQEEACKLGYFEGNPDWVNLGQGEPEVGPIEGAPERINHFDIELGDDRYGPLNGMGLLRTAIANYYNRLYRTNKSSKYTADNVSIAMGGRLALTRIFAILGPVRFGFKIPEYPAYKDMMLNHIHHLQPVCIPTKPEDNFSVPAATFEAAIKEHKLGAYLMSNPCNPTGHAVKGADLETYVSAARKQNCTLIMDEVYSHFIYDNGKPAAGPVSAAEYIGDVDKDPVLIVDALTKSFRYPGWRLAWVIGPKDIIASIGRSASGIDGGPSLPIQRAALQIFEPKRADQETSALRNVFSRKQNIMLEALRSSGMVCSMDANSTFYVWADISHLPAPLNNASVFFKEALSKKVVVVPGYLFDIEPKVLKAKTWLNNFVRFSFGPEEANLKMGLGRIVELINAHQ